MYLGARARYLGTPSRITVTSRFPRFVSLSRPELEGRHDTSKIFPSFSGCTAQSQGNTPGRRERRRLSVPRGLFPCFLRVAARTRRGKECTWVAKY